ERGSRPNRILTRQPPGACGLFVGFPDDRRIEVVVGVIFVLGIIIVIIVGVSRWHRVARDGDDTPVDQPDGNVLGDAMGHVGSCWMSRHSRTDVSARSRRGQSVCELARWLMGPGPQRAAAARRALISGRVAIDLGLVAKQARKSHVRRRTES